MKNISLRTQTYLYFDDIIKLVICDPSHLFDSNEWHEIVDMQMDPDSKSENLHNEGIIEYDGVDVLYCSTSSDGTYEVEYDDFSAGDISTDSGQMCVLKYADAMHINPELDLDSCVIIDEFTGELRASGEEHIISGDDGFLCDSNVKYYDDDINDYLNVSLDEDEEEI